jgi:hypothetical protein
VQKYLSRQSCDRGAALYPTRKFETPNQSQKKEIKKRPQRIKKPFERMKNQPVKNQKRLRFSARNIVDSWFSQKSNAAIQYVVL